MSQAVPSIDSSRERQTLPDIGHLIAERLLVMLTYDLEMTDLSRKYAVPTQFAAAAKLLTGRIFSSGGRTFSCTRTYRFCPTSCPHHANLSPGYSL